MLHLWVQMRDSCDPEGIGWLAAGVIPNSLSSAFFLYFSGICFVLLFLYFCRFCFALFLFSCSRWSFIFVDAPLIFICLAEHVPDWQPCILLVNLKNVHTHTHTHKMILLSQRHFKHGVLSFFVSPADKNAVSIHVHLLRH